MFVYPRTARVYRSTCRKFAACLVAAIAIALCLFAPGLRRASAQTTVASNVVISRIYTRGGEPGAIYQSDYIELFNRSNATVDINGWMFQITTSEGSLTSVTGLTIISSRGIGIEPGKHLLIQLTGGANGQPLPSPDFIVPVMKLGSTSGQIALLRKNQAVQFGQCLARDTTGTVADVVGYGTTNCFEGDGPAPAPTLTSAISREGGGCSDNDSNVLDFSLTAPAPRNGTDAAAPCNAPPPLSFFNFGVPQFDAAEGQGHASILVTRSGDVSGAASIEYIITGGTASERSDYTSAWGRLSFAPGETEKSFDILLTDDATQESSETVEMMLWHPAGDGAIVGFRDHASLVIHDNDFGPAPNPVDASAFYARQHYHDFLGREPDAAGLAFWTNNVESCGSDAQCRELKRIDTSAAFFLSLEFQRTGFLVYRLYRASLPDIPGRTRSMPRYAEFVRDTQQLGRGVVVGELGWEQRLKANTDAFLDEFIKRPDFSVAYPAQLTPAAYVDKLNAQAGGVLTQSERDALVAGLTAGQQTRQSVLRSVAENAEFSRRELNKAFVLMQYFGYLRRAPNDPPNTDFSGYDFWLQKLDEFGGDYRRAEMVKAFITSEEYRARFAAPAQ